LVSSTSPRGKLLRSFSHLFAVKMYLMSSRAVLFFPIPDFAGFGMTNLAGAGTGPGFSN